MERSLDQKISDVGKGSGVAEHVAAGYDRLLQYTGSALCVGQPLPAVNSDFEQSMLRTDQTLPVRSNPDYDTLLAMALVTPRCSRRSKPKS